MSQGSFCESTYPPKTNTIVSLKNVYKTYSGDIPVLQNYSMTVKQGQIYGLLGSSGCGKSTVLSCIIGLHKWDSGTITVFGEDARHGISLLHSKVGYMPQDHAMYSELTVGEMLHFYAKLYHITHTILKERMTLLENLLKLDEYGSHRINTLSGGQCRRVSLALAMMHDPKLLILDEPTAGLDPLLREKIWDHLFKLSNDNKTTVIITTHYIEEVKYAHMVGIMRRGTLLAEDDPSSLMEVHDTPLLEDVVLKICKMDNLHSKRTTTLTFPVSNSIIYGKEDGNDLISRRIVTVHNKSMKDAFIKPLIRIQAYNEVVWINFLRHPVFILLLVLLPPMQMLTTGVVIGTLPLSTTLGIVNNEVISKRKKCSHILNDTFDLKLLSCGLVNYFNSSIYLKMIEFPSYEKGRMAIERGEIMGYLEIPGNYSSYLIERVMFGMHPENTSIDGTIIKLNLDMSNTIIADTVIKAIHGAFTKFVKELSVNFNIDLRRFDVPFFFQDPVYGKKDTTVREYMLPSLITCILFEVAFIAAPLILINELNLKIFERSRVAGLQLWEMVSGIFLATTTITAIQSIVCFISVEFVLGFHIEGSFWAYILLSLVTAFCNSAFGLLMGIWLKDTVAIVLTEVFIFPILAIHSGVLQVLEAVPHPYRTIIFYLFPNVSMSTPLHWIMNRGASLTHSMVWPGVLVSIGWGLTFTILCVFLLRRL